MTKNWNAGRFTAVPDDLRLPAVHRCGWRGGPLPISSKVGADHSIPRHPESQALKEKYGPHRNSYSEEEWCIRDFFNDRRDGFFVDVGANDYKVTSNTYYLDTF